MATLVGDPRIEEANKTAFDRYLAAQPRLVDLLRAGEAIPALGPGKRRILHSGPPIGWPDMCGPQRGAIAGAILYEGWADDLDAAGQLAERGAVALAPCHEHSAGGPMAGIISPSMPVWAVENTGAGNRAFCNLNEGLGKVLRFGANSPEVLDRLRWLGGEFFATLASHVGVAGGAINSGFVGFNAVLAALAAAVVIQGDLRIAVLAALLATWFFGYINRNAPVPALASGFVVAVWSVMLLDWLHRRFGAGATKASEDTEIGTGSPPQPVSK